MSYYRESPSKRSPYDRSPVKILQNERDYIDEEIRLKSAYRNEAENRRLLDEISLLQIRTRKIDELEARCEALLKQNSLLTQENDNLSKELSEKRYDIERVKSSTIEVQERNAVRCHQLEDINRSLELEIDLLKKERLESNKMFEAHIQKIELMLEDRIKENEILSFKVNEMVNEREISEIKFEEEKNKLKNLISRTSYDLERELEYNKDKQTTEKFVELETMKKNHLSQIAVLEDEISKLKSANSYKNTEFESQLLENKNIKNRYEDEMKALLLENDSLRERILKLEQMNKTEVESIQEKYSDIHVKGTTSLKEQHQREIMLLLEEIDREKWIITEKNNEIQQLIREKREQQALTRDRELALSCEIDSLKNKLETEQYESTKNLQELTNKNNDLRNRNLRDSENYFDRVKGFLAQVKELEAEVDIKQDALEREKEDKVNTLRDMTRKVDELTDKIIRKEAALADSERQVDELTREKSNANEENQAAIQDLKEEVSRLSAALETEQQNKDNAGENYEKKIAILKKENAALKGAVAELEQKLSDEQAIHSQELKNLSANTSDKVKRLQATNKRLIDELNATHKNEIETLNLRIQKLERERDAMEEKLQEYIGLYEGLEKYFEKPHDRAAFEERSSSSIYETLAKTSKSTIHIF